jgi:hypothetical protein
MSQPKLLVVVCLVVMVRPSMASSGDLQKEVVEGPRQKRLREEVDALFEDFGAVGDLPGGERHAKEGSKVTPWLKEAASPRPDNAALVYYQAFLTRPEPSPSTRERIDAVLRGGEPDKELRTYLRSCRDAIQLAEVASQVPTCTWGIWPGHGVGGRLRGQLLRLVFVLALDARTLTADGDYRAALARCLTVRRIAAHAGDGTAFSNGVAVEAVAVRTMRHVLNAMPVDADLLTWLRGRLAVTIGATPSAAKTAQLDFEWSLHHLRSADQILQALNECLMERSQDDKDRSHALPLSADKLASLARASYSGFLNAVLRVIDRKLPHERTLAEIGKIASDAKGKCENHCVAAYMMAICGRQVPKFYEVEVRHEADICALKAAVEIYLIRAETGNLPETLPAGLPKDPYGGQDFQYEVTRNGFVLRSGVKSPDRRRAAYEFKVRAGGNAG